MAYKKFAELTGDQNFKSACATMWGTNQSVTSEGFGLYPQNTEALGQTYTASSDSWRVQGHTGDAIVFDYTFAPTEKVATPDANVIQYRLTDANGFAVRYTIATPIFGTTTAEYMRATRLFTRPGKELTDFFCVIGVPTELTDTVPTTTLNYSQFAVSGTVFAAGKQYDIGESVVTLSVAPTGALTTTMTVVGREFTPTGLSTTRTTIGNLKATASVSGDVQSFNAPVVLPDNTLGGTMGGWFFGPQGREAGLSVNFTGQINGINVVLAAAIAARR